MPSSWCAREIGQAQSLSEVPSLSGAASEVQVGSSGSLLESSPTDPEAAMTLFCYPTQCLGKGTTVLHVDQAAQPDFADYVTGPVLRKCGIVFACMGLPRAAKTPT